MEHVAHALRWFVDTLLGVLDGLPPAISLAVVAAGTALVILATVRRASPQRLIARARAQIAGSIFEMRLYLDDPRRVLAAQGRLLAWTLVYLVCLVPAAAVLTPPLGVLFLELEVRHGLAPFSAPSTVVVRVEIEDPAATDQVVIDAIGGLVVTAVVRDREHGAVYARVGILEPGRHHVVARLDRATVMKLVVADPTATVVAPERRGGLARLWTLGPEPPPATDRIRSISVQHPDRPAVLPIPWWAYWLGLATVFALASRRRFGVAL